MSHIAYISHRLGQILVEAPRNPRWAAAINHVIPSTDRKTRDGIWYIQEKWYFAIKAITERFYPHFSDLVLFDDPIVVVPTTEWLEDWNIFLHGEERPKQRFYDFNDLQFKDDPNNPYNVLYITSSAPPEVIKAAYRALSKLYHPDAGGDPDEFKKLETAYQEITGDSAN